MSYNTHIDHFGLLTTSAGALYQRKSGKQVSPGNVGEAEDDIGDVIAIDKNGERSKLQSDYLVQGDLAMDTAVVLGTLIDATKALLVEVNVTTEKGKAPELSASGEKMNAEATQGATITLPEFTVAKLHKAQILFGAFTLAGTGCKLNKCSAKVNCNNSLGEVAGEIKSHDVQRGMIEVQADIIQSGATAPTITAANGFIIVDGPSLDNPEGGHDMWTVTLRKPLTTTPVSPAP